MGLVKDISEKFEYTKGLIKSCKSKALHMIGRSKVNKRSNSILMYRQRNKWGKKIQQTFNFKYIGLITMFHHRLGTTHNPMTTWPTFWQGKAYQCPQLHNHLLSNAYHKTSLSHDLISMNLHPVIWIGTYCCHGQHKSPVMKQCKHPVRIGYRNHSNKSVPTPININPVTCFGR